MDDVWSSLDFTIHEPERKAIDQTGSTMTVTTEIKKDWYGYYLFIKFFSVRATC